MRHQVFSYYYQLSLKDKVEPIRCVNEDHKNPMAPAIDENSETYLWCIECKSILKPGYALYEKLIERINIADPYPEDLTTNIS